MTAPRVTAADLTPRQIAVASLVARFFTNKQIAAELGVTERRVAALVSSIAYTCCFEPGRDERSQIAVWFREQAPVTVESDVAVPANAYPLHGAPRYSKKE